MQMFTGRDRAMAPAMLGMMSVLALPLRPTVGGLITDTAVWRWLFFINVPPGMAATGLALMVIRGMGRGDQALLPSTSAAARQDTDGASGGALTRP